MGTDIFPISLGFCTSYVLRGDGVIAIDAGQPNKGDAFRNGLKRAGIPPEKVGLILLTHAHWDHMGSARELKEMTGAPLGAHAREAEWVESASAPPPPGVTTWGRTVMSVLRLIVPFIKVPPASVERRLGDHETSLEEFGIPGTIVHTPGHSPGSISVVLESGEAFVGDLAMNKFPLRLSPGLPVLADDIGQVVRSWTTLLKHRIDIIYPAHGPPFPAEVMEMALDAYQRRGLTR